MKSLRARAFAAIAVAVLAAVAVTLVVAAVLVRRSVKHEALSALARQATLIAAQERAKPSPPRKLTDLGVFFETQEERLAIISIPQAALLLPPDGASALHSGRTARGSVEVGDRNYLYAARPVGRRAIVLLRSAKLEASDWRPFTLAFVIAAAAGAGIAAIAAFLLAGAVARPIRRVAVASRRLASGETHGPLPVEGPTEVASLSLAFNQMAEDLDHAKDAERSFLLSVSHELKTPLASIRGHGEALLDRVLDVPKGAGVIVQEAKRLERLVRDLLDLARLNQRTFTVTPRRIDLIAVAAEAVGRHEHDAREIGVSLGGEGPAAAPAIADSDRVLQVLSNLIENALRSTPARGRVTVTAKPGELSVSDTGPGLAAEDLPHAFERFFLHSRYATNRAVGTGLGLAIVKELTEAMEGSVTVESVVGRGTTFVVRLPQPDA
ncbi:MAG TPA: HAMP domain-containing sensor histidine kinase [Gaiellaceae bacterium]